MLFEHYHTMLNARDFKRNNDPDNIWAVERAYDRECEIISDLDYSISAKAHDVGDYTINFCGDVVYVDVYTRCDYAVYYSKVPESELAKFVSSSAGKSTLHAYEDSADFKEYLTNDDL